MKKLTVLSLVFFYVLLAPSTIVAQHKTAAVVTCYVDKNIDFSSMSSSTQLVSGLASLAKDTNFNLTPQLNAFHERFFNEYAQNLPFSLMSHEQVTTNPDYVNFTSRFGESENDGSGLLFDAFVPYKGYKVLYHGGLVKKEDRNQNKMLEIFKETAQGVIFISINYKFIPKVAFGGMGSAGIQANVRIKMYNAEGKKVFSIFESAMSKGSVGMVAGIPVMSPEEIQPLCIEATEKLFTDLDKKLPKIFKKVGKKF